VGLLSGIRPTRRDAVAIGGVLVVAVRCLAVAMLPPAAVGAALGEVDAASALVIGAALAWLVTAPVRARLVDRRPGGLTWSRAFAAAGMAWPVGAAVAAVPFLLSHHYVRPVDALVEAMAGLTTTGLSFVHDLDHLALATNLWRHALHPLGAVGVLVVIALLRLRGPVVVTTSNVAEAGDERVLPRRDRVVAEAVLVVGSWSAAGTVALVIVGLVAGLPPGRALVHGVTLATSALSTGGFTLTSASARSLHSATGQLVLVVLMIAGATSLLLHRAARQRRVRGAHRELDVRVLGWSWLVVGTVTCVGLARAGVHTTVEPLVRQGLFTAVAAHTTTGMTVVQGPLLAEAWGDLAPAALVVAMGIGGMGASIAGGVSALRVGIIGKGIVRDVRRLLLPEAAVVIETYQQDRRHRLTDSHVRATATILLLLITAVFATATVTLATTTTGDLPEALFAATSAVSTTGLSLGFVEPDVPGVVVASFGLLMWFGRLEFLAVLAGLGMLAGGIARRTRGGGRA
jgi:trk system potassium uptake protein TrkH